LKRHKQSWPFLNPVSKQEVPNYYEIITEPVGKFIEKDVLRTKVCIDILYLLIYLKKIKDISMISAKLGR